MDLKPGSRWRSAVCGVEVVVVRPPRAPVTLQCGGLPVVPPGAAAAPAQAAAAATLIGKRYADEASGIEVLCVKPGPSSLSVDGRALALRDARPLPSSD